jgi:cobalt-zinc-cadmium efflux system membrane fusion protein
MKAASLALFVCLPLLSCSAGSSPEPSPKPDDNLVEMGIDAQKNIGLTVAPAGLGDLTEYLRVSGTVQPIDSKAGYVRPLARGRVEEVLVRVGDRVASGQPLAQLDNIEAGELAAGYLAAQAELQKLKVQQANAARQVERSQSLAEIGAIARKDVELIQAEHDAMLEAIRAQESLLAGLDSKLRRFGLQHGDLRGSSVTAIRSSFAGVVTRVNVAPGEVVDPDMTLFSIADLSEVWVQAEVYERDLARVRIGQPALISVDTYPSETFSGTVTHISDTLDPKTRAAQVRCVVANKDRRLKLDMFVTVDVPTIASRKALAVPADAVQQIEGKTVVFVRASEQKFRVREVKVGLVTAGRAEILGGLAENESVVIQGAYHLKSILMIDKLRED